MIRSGSIALLQEVVVIKQLMFGPISCNKSIAQSVDGYLIRRMHTNVITRRSTCDKRKAQIMTCNVVVGLVLCQSSDGRASVFSGKSDSCV